MTLTLDEVRSQFELFAEVECGDEAPLYRAITRGTAGDDGLLTLANEGREGVRRANLLLAAVHYLVLKRPDTRLAAIYRDGLVTDDAFPAFQAFAAQRVDEVRELVRTRLVQTNEVNRCSALLPGLAATQAVAGGRSLALIDVGASAGLQLAFDRYRYAYSTEETAGPDGSPVVVACEVRGVNRVPVPESMPDVVSRVGVDMSPVDLGDEDARLWMRALVWPEQKARMARLDAAIEVALEDPPDIRQGDALVAVPELVAAIPEEVVPVIYHSHVMAHMPPDVQRAFVEEVIPALGAARDIAWLACEGSTMVLTTWLGGVQDERLLANRDPHGEWIEWVG